MELRPKYVLFFRGALRACHVVTKIRTLRIAQQTCMMGYSRDQVLRPKNYSWPKTVFMSEMFFVRTRNRLQASVSAFILPASVTKWWMSRWRKDAAIFFSQAAEQNQLDHLNLKYPISLKALCKHHCWRKDQLNNKLKHVKEEHAHTQASADNKARAQLSNQRAHPNIQKTDT